MSGRRVRVAALPQMRLACFEGEGDADGAEKTWEALEEWRVRARPPLGRIDIAAIGWFEPQDGGISFVFRAGVPVRGDYRVPAPAKARVFPAALFAYITIDDNDEYEAGLHEALAYIEREGLELASGPVEAVRYHFNLNQRPADCGFLVEGEVAEQASHERPLPIAPRE
jgi:effector-binding domain-containing protein